MKHDTFEFKIIPETLVDFIVVEYTAQTALSDCYAYKIHILSSTSTLNMDALLKARASFMVKNDATANKHNPQGHSIFGEIETIQLIKEWGSPVLVDGTRYAFEYAITFVPEFTRLRYDIRSKVYVNQSVPAIIDAVLGRYNFPYELKLTGYKTDGEDESQVRDFTFQYRQSDYDFISYWLERIGGYFYFEFDQSTEKEVLIVTDAPHVHNRQPGLNLDTRVHYMPLGSDDDCFAKQQVSQGTLQAQHVPSKIIVKGYNYTQASTEIMGEATLHDGKQGEVAIFDEMVQDEAEASLLAKTFAGGYFYKQETAHFKRLSRPFLSGFTFVSDEHYSPALNAEFLVTASHEEGSVRQTLQAMSSGASEDEQTSSFSCSFDVLSCAKARYYTPIRTKINRIYGVVCAKLDSADSDEYCDLDEMGRYKVRFLQETEPSEEKGKNSCRIRKLESFVGDNYGQSQPMRPGVEVMVSFLDGNPNCPYISGAVYNSDNKNLMSNEEPHVHRVRAKDGQEVIVDEQNGYRCTRSQDGSAVHITGNFDKGKDEWNTPNDLMGMGCL